MTTKLTNISKVFIGLALAAMMMFMAGLNIMASPPANDPSPGLFVAAGTDQLVQQDETPALLRSRLVEIDFNHLEAAGETAQGLPVLNETLQLNLFEDTVLTAVKVRVEPNATGGGYVWAGRIKDSPFSMANFVVKDRLIAGDIITLDGIYRVRPVSEGLHNIRQFDLDAIPPSDTHDDAVPSASGIVSQNSDGNTLSQASIAGADGSVIDLMVAYTPAACNYYGGTQGIEREIDMAIAYANTAYANSGISHRLRLVHLVEVAYTEADLYTDFDRLENPSDGYMDNLHALRDTYFADLVSLWAKNTESTFSTDGRGSLLTSLDPVVGGDSAFSVVHVGQIGRDEIFTHELGHNMGANHDWYTQGPPGYGDLYTYNRGVIIPHGFTTIMAYQTRCLRLGLCPYTYCPRVPYFSNPDIIVNGYPTGVKANTDFTSCTANNLNNPDCDADNHMVLNNTSRTVANFREPSSLGVSLSSQPTLVQTTTTAISYTLTMYNGGSQEITGIQVTNDLPVQANFDGGVNRGGTYASNQITWLGLVLPPYGLVDLTFRVRIPADTLSEGEVLHNIVQAVSNEGVTLSPTQLATLVSPPYSVYLPIVLKRSDGTSIAPQPCTPDPPGDSDDIADALTICSGQTISGQVGISPEWTDVYKFSAGINELIKIQMDGVGPGDAWLTLYPPGTSTLGDPLKSYSDNIGNYELILQTTVAEAGEWYVAVKSLNEVNYDLTMTVSPTY